MIIFILLPFLITQGILSQADLDEYLSLEIRTEKIDIGFVSPLNSPIEIPGAIKGTIQSNTEWILICSAEGDFLSREGDRMPLGRLAWRIEGGEWVSFEMGEDKVLEGSAAEETGRDFSIDLRLDLKWQDSPGDFLTNIDFTLMKK
ncbi:hypothetical protein JW879_03835 [candidate division WOR-3 bacterium]|nr:hypothetical protein [candidate division WOR-3 bacterium]